ncbi:MAG: helix-turn-helix domain-containing protein [Deltaproteobacteria bacterium]|nr:helix-turn-helix domain-containing protein [Deltaproteobacteria bacterium]MCL4873823.1 helix-turn-helix domain-containing protein [bacterium]
MLTMHQAAEYLGVSWETLRKWVALGLNVPCYRYPSPASPPRFRQADLDEYIERHKIAAREPRKRPVGIRRVV